MLCPIPFNEVHRQMRLKAYGIHVLPENTFAGITRLARLWFGTPTAAVNFVTDDSQVLKGAPDLGISRTPRQDSFCAHVILGDDVFVVCDATADRRFADNPFVKDEPHIRFYAGAPIVTADGFRLGAVCVIDSEPRPPLSSRDKDYLRTLADKAMERLNLCQAAESGAGNERSAGPPVVDDQEESAFDPASAAKREFLAMISHELRTPLNAIIGFSEMLAEETFGPHSSSKYREYAGDIQVSAEHAQELIDHMLKYVELDTGDLVLNQAWTCSMSVLSKVRQVCEPHAKQSGAVLSVQQCEGIPLLIDSDLLSRALANLVINAIQANEAGTSVTVGFGVDGQGLPAFQVDDEGPGLPHSVVQQLGEPFLKGQAADVTQASGLGLGLPIADRIVRLHGGALRPVGTFGDDRHRLEIVLPEYRRASG